MDGMISATNVSPLRGDKGNDGTARVMVNAFRRSTNMSPPRGGCNDEATVPVVQPFRPDGAIARISQRRPVLEIFRPKGRMQFDGRWAYATDISHKRGDSEDAGRGITTTTVDF